MPASRNNCYWYLASIADKASVAYPSPPPLPPRWRQKEAKKKPNKIEADFFS